MGAAGFCRAFFVCTWTGAHFNAMLRAISLPGEAMTKIVNLRQARKQRARDDKRAKGDANAAKFGEAKPDRLTRQAEADRAERVHQGHKRDE